MTRGIGIRDFRHGVSAGTMWVCGCVGGGLCKNARRPSADHVWPRERMYIIMYRLRPATAALQQPLRDLHRRITRGIYNTMYRPGNRALTRTACFMAAARNVMMCVCVYECKYDGEVWRRDPSERVEMATCENGRYPPPPFTQFTLA